MNMSATILAVVLAATDLHASTLVQTVHSGGYLPTDMYDGWDESEDDYSAVQGYRGVYVTPVSFLPYDEALFGPLAKVILNYNVRYEISGDYDDAVFIMGKAGMYGSSFLDLGVLEGEGTRVLSSPDDLFVFVDTPWFEGLYEIDAIAGAVALGREVRAEFLLYQRTEIIYVPLSSIPTPASLPLLMSAMAVPVFLSRRRKISRKCD